MTDHIKSLPPQVPGNGFRDNIIIDNILWENLLKYTSRKNPELMSLNYTGQN